MYNVIIDPSCLKPDAEEINDEVVNQFVELLLDIGDMQNYNFINSLVPAEFFETNFTEELNIFNLPSYISGNDYSGNDFVRILNYLTQAVVDFKAEENKLDFSSLSIKSVDGDTDFSLSESLLKGFIISNIFKGHTFLRSKWHARFQCYSEVQDLEEKEVYHYEEFLKLCTSTNQILKEVDFVDLWKGASTRVTYEEIIQVYFSLRIYHEKMREWSLGRDFFENLRKYGFHTESTKIKALLKAMLLVVQTDEPNRKAHKLRISKSGGAPAIVGPLGTGMRMDIGYEFHLHFWEKQNQVVFASINTHNDFSIPD